MKKNIKAPHNMVTFVFMIIFALAILVSISRNITVYKELKAEEAALLESIDAENQRTQELYKEQEYYTSDEYIEGIARNQLGLIKPNEIVFLKN